jgi:hypothetical protein
MALSSAIPYSMGVSGLEKYLRTPTVTWEIDTGCENSLRIEAMEVVMYQ